MKALEMVRRMAAVQTGGIVHLLRNERLFQWSGDFTQRGPVAIAPPP